MNKTCRLREQAAVAIQNEREIVLNAVRRMVREDLEHLSDEDFIALRVMVTQESNRRIMARNKK